MTTETALPVAQTPASTAPKRTHKTRIVRRRGRARDDDIDDDGVIERAALSDTEGEGSDQDDSASEDEDDEHAAPQAPGEAPPAAPSAVVAIPASAPEEVPTPPADSASATTLQSSGPPSKETSHLWSDEMDQSAIQDLPVIDFAELSRVGEGESIDALLQRKAPATDNSDPSPSVPTIDAVSPVSGESALPNGKAPSNAGTAKPKHVSAHVIARESYLKKLNTDPSFTPRVGQFWGHDDRLMDTGERPLSEWWRIKWATRGMRGGRGGFGGRGGRGGFVGNGSGGEPPVEKELEPIESRWGHDGFEEQSKQGAPRGGDGRGGGLGGRGRGWYKERRGAGAARGRGSSNRAMVSPPLPSTSTPSEKRAQLQAQAAAKMASQQPSVTFPAAVSPLSAPTSADAATPPTTSKAIKKAAKRQQQPTSDARSKLDAALNQAAKERETSNAKSVIAMVKTEVAAEKQTGGSAPATPPAVAPAPKTKESSPLPVRINLPKAAGKKQRQPAPFQPAPPPHLGPANDLVVTLPPIVKFNAGDGPTSAPLVVDLQQQQTHQRRASDKDRSEAMERAILKGSFTKVGTTSSPAASDAAASPTTSQPPAPSVVGLPIAPLATQPSPNPHYSYVTLPAGIAMGESGMLYEIATGRPVMLNQPSQPTPPLPAPPIMGAPPPMVPMYNPRPMLHPHAAGGGRSGSMSFIPPHVLNPDYPPTPPTYAGYAASPTPVEPSRGTPNFFAPPKTSGRVQIRPPTTGGKSEERLNHQSTATATAPKSATRTERSHSGAAATNDYSSRVLAQDHQFGGSGTTAVHNSGQQQRQSSTSASSGYHSMAPPADQYYNGGYYPTQSSTPGAYGGASSSAGASATEDPYYSGYYSQQYGYGAVDYGYGQEAAAYTNYGTHASQEPHQSQQQFQATQQQNLYY